jgi:glycosyltransferase involved in cell wall biosynthesis
LLLADEPGIAAVVSLHTTYAMAKPYKPEWSLRPLLEHWHVNRVIAAEKALLARSGHVLANSDAILEAVVSHYGLDLSARARVAPHGTSDPLTADAARAASREAAVAEGAPLRVLCVGRFEPRKGFDISAQVAARVLGARKGVQFWFVGDTLSDAHRATLASAGAGQLETSPDARFLGVLSRAALEQAFLDCDLVLAPSRFESFGLVAIEAMAARRPVLTLAAGGLAEVVEDGVSGRLWTESPSVADDIAAEILRLDAERQALLALGRGARAAYEARYTMAAMGEALEAAYRRASAAAADANR